MLCPNCNSNQPDDAKFCSSCGSDLSPVQNLTDEKDITEQDAINQTDIAIQNLINQNNAENQDNQTLPWYLSMPFIITLYCLCLAPVAIALYIIRFNKTKDMPEKRKNAIISGIITLVVSLAFFIFIVLLGASVETPEEQLKNINAAITLSDYQKAEELINKAFEDGNASTDVIYAKFRLYEKQGMYDKAADVLVVYVNAFDDKTVIADDVINKINETKALCSSEFAAKLDKCLNDINSQKQAKAEAEEKAKAEAEEKARQAAEAEERAKAEAEEKARQEAEAKAKAEEEARIKAETEALEAEKRAAAEAAAQAKSEAEKNALFYMAEEGEIYLNGYIGEEYNVNVDGFQIYNIRYETDIFSTDIIGYAKNTTSKRRSLNAKVRYYNYDNIQIGTDYIYLSDVEPGKVAEFKLHFVKDDAVYFDIIDDAW